jgi:hypothetical protein
MGWYRTARRAFVEQVALTVGCSLVGIVTFGSLAGSMLPFLLRARRVRSASASAPLVATLVDVTGLSIYFGVAWLLLLQGERRTATGRSGAPERRRATRWSRSARAASVDRHHRDRRHARRRAAVGRARVAVPDRRVAARDRSPAERPAMRREARRGLPTRRARRRGQAMIGGLSLGALRYIPRRR